MMYLLRYMRVTLNQLRFLSVHILWWSAFNWLCVSIMTQRHAKRAVFLQHPWAWSDGWSRLKIIPCSLVGTLIARLMGSTWGPSGADRTQEGPMLSPWILLSGYRYRTAAHVNLKISDAALSNKTLFFIQLPSSALLPPNNGTDYVLISDGLFVWQQYWKKNG